MKKNNLPKVFFVVMYIVCLMGICPTLSAQNTGLANGATITSFTLTSDTTQALAPFTIGLGFRKGDVKGYPKLNIANQQVIVKKRWSDGSVKHAIASGRIALTAGIAKMVSVRDSAAATGGIKLTAADIKSANPVASVQLGTIGTVALSSLLASPFRTWISGPEMVEAHYRSFAGKDSTLEVWFYVRYYKGGRIWIRTSIENGYLDIKTVNKLYIPTVKIGTTLVFNNGGTTLTNYAHTGWTAEGWIGGNPAVIPAHDPAYLMATKLVPNYWKHNPSAARLNTLKQVYVPMDNGNWTPYMPDTGYQPQLGILSLWDALYVTSCDKRAYKFVIANANAFNSYGIVWNDSKTHAPARPSDRPTWTMGGPGDGGYPGWPAGPYTWQVAHHPSAGYLPYLITGDYYYLKTMEYNAASCYFAGSSINGSGTSRIFKGETRGAAWSIRTIVQLAGIAPDNDSIGVDYQRLLAGNMNAWASIISTLNGTGIGYFYEYNVNMFGVTGKIAPWQQHFFMQSVGMGYDIEALPGSVNYVKVRDFLYRGAVGILGNSTGYCFTKAYPYAMTMSLSPIQNPTAWLKDWKSVYEANYGTPGPACANTLEGASGGDPAVASSGYWGNLMPAIAYAVDHGAPGAASAWKRLTGASNWSAVENSGFDDTPMWGIIPRVNIISGISSQTEKQAIIKIFPNPSTGIFNIDLSALKKKETELTLYNVIGELISKEIVDTPFHELNLSNNTEGMYLIKILNGDEQSTYRVTLAK
jgi:hypothetical protein